MIARLIEAGEQLLTVTVTVACAPAGQVGLGRIPMADSVPPGPA